MKKLLGAMVALFLSVFYVMASANILDIPNGMKNIDEEAFYNDTAIDEVILPEGIEQIGPRAFAGMNLNYINLPSSLMTVADDAFDGINYSNIYIPQTGAGYDWAIRQHLRAPHGNKTSGIFHHNGGSDTIKTGTVIEHKTSDGSFDFTCTVFSMRTLLQLQSNGAEEIHIFAYGINEYPNFNDHTQINRRVGNLFFDEKYNMDLFMQMASQANVNSSGLISVNLDDLKRAKYCIVHFGLCYNGETTPSSWGSYAIHLRESNYVSGRVIDSITGNGLAGVTVSSELSSTVTDENGYYTLSVLVGEQIIHFELEGYFSYDKQITITEDEEPSETAVIELENEASADINAEKFRYSPNDDGISCTVIGYIGTPSGDLCIPARSPDGLKVTHIGNKAFENRSGFNGNLTIPEGIISIGNRAFFGCDNLIGDLIIPEGVTSIGESAFEYCDKMRGELSIPEGITTIEKKVFSCCGFTGNLTIPSSVTSIGESAFEACTRFTGDLIIPEGVTSIGQAAFNGCIGFNGNLSLPSSLTYIGPLAFYWCHNLTGSLILPEGELNIGYNAFGYCSGFTGSLKIPGSCDLDADVFKYCTGFNGTLTISEGITFISASFLGCSGFTGSLIIPEGVKGIIGGFEDCTGFNGNLRLPEGLERIDKNTFKGCGFTGKLIIPGSVTSIGRNAFLDCDGFEKINVTLTHDDGSTSVESRTAVYCVPGSYAWRWAQDEQLFEPVDLNTLNQFSFELSRVNNDMSVSQIIYKRVNGTETLKQPIVLVGKAISGKQFTFKLTSDLPWTLTKKGDWFSIGGTSVTGIAGTTFLDITFTNKVTDSTHSGTLSFAFEDGMSIVLDVRKNEYTLFDSAFTESSSELNNALISASVVGAAYAYKGQEQAKTYLEGLGFDNPVALSYASGTHTVGHTFGHKLVADSDGNIVNLYAVMLRGTNGSNKEWKSNFTVGSGSMHYGFSQATRDVYGHLMNYMSIYNEDIANGKYIIWICGHSRGSAVGNLLAGYYLSFIPQNRIYAYLFATPNVGKNVSTSQHYNIKNFVIGGDIIPRLPLISWGYHKYGLVYTLEDDEAASYGLNSNRKQWAMDVLGAVGSVITDPAVLTEASDIMADEGKFGFHLQSLDKGKSLQAIFNVVCHVSVSKLSLSALPPPIGPLVLACKLAGPTTKVMVALCQWESTRELVINMVPKSVFSAAITLPGLEEYQSLLDYYDENQASSDYMQKIKNSHVVDSYITWMQNKYPIN